MDALLEEMPATLFAEWAAYWDKEPFGPVQEDLRAALVVTKLHNVNRCKRSDPVLEPGDVFPTLVVPKRLPTPEELQAKLEMTMAAWGGVR